MIRRMRFAMLTSAVVGLLVAPATVTGQAMPAAEQNVLVQKHCAVCHSDTTPNGGLSLEHFDGAQTPPSLAAVMLSKIVGGLSLDTIQAAPSHLDAKTLVATRMKGGAMLAAGVPPPSDATTYAFIEALASTARGARDWSVGPEGNAPTNGRTVAASILREVPRPEEGQAAMYRLILTCNATSREGEMRLSWSPVPTEGTLLAAVDTRAPVARSVQGREKMGNGSAAPPTPPASVVLSGSRTGDDAQRIPLPGEKLTISGLFADTVDFPFDRLPPAARQRLTPCFTSEGATR